MNRSAAPLDRVFHALADATRLGMIEQLSRGPASVKALAAPLSIALPTVMKHLKVLEDGKLVRSEKSGRVRTYSIRAPALAQIDRWVAQRRAVSARALADRPFTAMNRAGKVRATPWFPRLGVGSSVSFSQSRRR
jgi:DNA-binding transcriptional ArsR family regulator